MKTKLDDDDDNGGAGKYAVFVRVCVCPAVAGLAPHPPPLLPNYFYDE